MGLPVEVNNLMLGSLGGYTVGRSLRFRNSATAYLSRSPASAGNQQKMTFSFWAKRGQLGVSRGIYCSGASGSGATQGGAFIQFQTTDTLTVNQQTNNAYDWILTPTQVFRDPSAWYHIVVAIDTTQATASNRVLMYVNGVQVTSFSSATYPTLNLSTKFNASGATNLGATIDAGAVYFPFDGYLAEVNFIDGQALTPSSFGAYDTNGVWQPKKYSGTYGTNGFYLPFSDNSTIEALSKDGSNTNPELITNGMFVSNVSGWTVSTGTAGSPSITWQSAHTARIANSANNGVSYYQAISTVIGQTYYVQGYVTNISIGGSTREARIIKADDTSYATNSVTIGAVQQSAGSGWIRGTFTATATTTYIFMLADVIGTGTQGADFSFMSVSLGGYRNSWNPFNISLTAGATYDSMIDSPTNAAGTSTGIGNYAVLNPLSPSVGSQLSNGNLTSSNGGLNVFSTIQLPTSGKWYAEFNPSAVWNTGAYLVYGAMAVANASGTYSGLLATTNASNGGIYQNGSFNQAFTTWATTDVIGIAVDMGANTVQVYRNGSTLGTAVTLPSGDLWFYVSSYAGGNVINANFGQRPFTYTPPSGYKALNTYNLPAVSISNGAKHFGVNLYTGTGATQSITNSGSFQPDLVWGKQRNGASSNVLTDSVRGTNSQLSSNLTNAQDTQTDVVTAFNSNGFTVGASAGFNMNQSGSTLVAWQWKGGGTAVTNNSGTISSQVSANTSAGISILTYTGNGTAGATVGHGLGVTPSMIIQKRRDASANNWVVWHTSTGNVNPLPYLNLNTTAAVTNGDSSVMPGTVNSTTFTIGSWNGINASGGTYVAYCFSAVRGFSAFGSYTGNGSADGPFVYTGHRPRWLMIKNSSYAGTGWRIFDTSRSSYNVATERLWAHSSAAESTASAIDILSNGFKIRDASLSDWFDYNKSGDTMIYMAFAENPFNSSRAR